MKPIEIWIQEQIEKKRRKVEEAVKYGKPFRTKNSTGYKYEGRKFLMHRWTKPIQGANYKPSSCTCIPWDDCSCGERKS